MPKPNCKDCSNFDAAYGLPGRCKLAIESINHKILNGSVNADELRYLVRVEELPDEYWQRTCENFEQKGKRTNREALNVMSNKQLAYDSISDTEPDCCVCSEHHERMNGPEAGSRICIEGFTKWLCQEESWWMKEEVQNGQET